MEPNFHVQTLLERISNAAALLDRTAPTSSISGIAAAAASVIPPLASASDPHPYHVHTNSVPPQREHRHPPSSHEKSTSNLPGSHSDSFSAGSYPRSIQQPPQPPSRQDRPHINNKLSIPVSVDEKGKGRKGAGNQPAEGDHFQKNQQHERGVKRSEDWWAGKGGLGAEVEGIPGLGLGSGTRTGADEVREQPAIKKRRRGSELVDTTAMELADRPQNRLPVKSGKSPQQIFEAVGLSSGSGAPKHPKEKTIQEKSLGPLSTPIMSKTDMLSDIEMIVISDDESEENLPRGNHGNNIHNNNNTSSQAYTSSPSSQQLSSHIPPKPVPTDRDNQIETLQQTITLLQKQLSTERDASTREMNLLRSQITELESTVKTTWTRYEQMEAQTLELRKRNENLERELRDRTKFFGREIERSSQIAIIFRVLAVGQKGLQQMQHAGRALQTLHRDLNIDWSRRAQDEKPAHMGAPNG
ncbi:hypothetical protein HK102_001998 [Quaeritorhiza haematococci]|nr:hypothetical protein HK102_001998 [Quaeritorhiza haematococci]